LASPCICGVRGILPRSAVVRRYPWTRRRCWWPEAFTASSVTRCYVGVLLTILGQALWFESASTLWYALAVALLFHLFVVLYEEPALRRRLGES
jgi:protein-S-isoprenylcysteine O-methyltransferase Ste14